MNYMIATKVYYLLVKYIANNMTDKVEIDKKLYDKLCYLGIIDNSGVRDHNIGNSDYSKHIIQSWTIWLDYPELTAWDDDIIKRILRNKQGDSRKLDYEKIIHICNERIRQINLENKK